MFVGLSLVFVGYSFINVCRIVQFAGFSCMKIRRENYNLLLPLARFGQLAKCVQCYIGQICPSIHWTDLAIDKWHNMSTHRKDLILLYLLPSSFSPPPPPPPSLSPPLSLSDLLHATVISLQYYFTYITLYLITFELSEI